MQRTFIANVLRLINSYIVIYFCVLKRLNVLFFCQNKNK